MKAYHSVFVFIILITCTIASSIHSYHAAEGNIIRDMNQALAQTLKTKTDGYLTPDTLYEYRRHLQIDSLRQSSFVYYAVKGHHDGLQSRKIKWRQLEFQSYANCSVATVFSLSDQRLSGLFASAALLWFILSMGFARRRHTGFKVLGAMAYHEEDGVFFNLHHQPIRFTPMQEQLMTLFFQASDFKLPKETICQKLWPNKPDASETLYTLMKRLKPIVEEQGGLHIICDRGRSYQLQKKH